MEAMKESYDVLVVGAGPGGSSAAAAAAGGGVSVLLVEKDREVGVPVRCAEGVSHAGLEEAVERLRPEWIASEIRGARMVAPDGTVVDAYPDDRGYILHRKLFDADLAVLAAEAGAVLRTRTFVSNLEREKKNWQMITISGPEGEKRIRARIVIGADGVESRVGRWVGLAPPPVPEEMECCVQYTLAGIRLDPGRVELHFGSKVAPGGYAWIFPKSATVANVGLGISGGYNRIRRAGEYLTEFTGRRFPGASVLTQIAGGVPVAAPLKQLTADGVMLVGDAARQANPLTGGGIVNAILAGKIAGSVAADAIREGDFSGNRLAAYTRSWNRGLGKEGRLSYKIKRVVDSLSDDDLNKTARLLLDIPPERLTGFQLFKAALVKHPKLILDAAKIFL